jgi:hypothetical protein
MLRDTTSGLNRLLHDLLQVYEIEDISGLFCLLLYLPLEDSFDPRFHSHVYSCSISRGLHGLFIFASCRWHLQSLL